MKPEPESPQLFPGVNPYPVKFSIVYEDFASGTRARHFAERLAKALGCTCLLTEALWRSELLDCPEIAEQAARTCADSDYLIISLRGDRDLPLATREWIEAQLDGAGGARTGLILLSDERNTQRRVLDGTRHHLRALCNAREMAFFSHATTSPDDVTNGRSGTTVSPPHRLARPLADADAFAEDFCAGEFIRGYGDQPQSG
jgi:hypothetical protein